MLQAFSLLFLLTIAAADPPHEIQFPFVFSENQPTSSQVYGNTTGVVEEHVAEQQANLGLDHELYGTPPIGVGEDVTLQQANFELDENPLFEDLIPTHQGNPNINNVVPAGGHQGNPNINNVVPAGGDNDIDTIGLRILVSEYNKYPIDRRIHNTDDIDADLFRLSGLSARDTRLCRFALQLGIYDFLAGPEHKKRKANFKSEEEKTRLKNLIKQENKGFEDWDRIAKVLRLTNPLDCETAWKKIREEIELEEMLDFGVDFPPFFPPGGGGDGEEPPAGGAGSSLMV